MATREAFEDAIASDQWNAVHRLVFADWLEEQGHDDDAAFYRGHTQEKLDAAKAYMEKYASDNDLSFDRLMVGAMRWINGDGWEYTRVGGVGMYPEGDADLTDQTEFWEAYGLYMCMIVPEEKRSTFLTCNC